MDVGGFGGGVLVKILFRFIVAVVGAGLLLIAGGTGPAAAVIDNPDVDTAGTYTYVVDPDGGAVEVTATISVTADKPNRYLNNGDFYQYYFSGQYVIIPGAAEDLTVTDDAGRSLSYVIEEDEVSQDDDVDGITVLNINFRRNIFHRQTAVIVISFRLPGAEARSDQLARVNEAYAGFEVWVDPALEQASVSIETPDDFTDSSTGTAVFEVTDIDDGGQRFTIDDVDAETFWVIASLSRDSSLTETTIDVDGYEVLIRSWPGDTAWLNHVTDSMTDGLPALIDTVGLPWPLQDQLTITESYTPYINGYAGWYDHETNEIQMGDELDQHVAYHELAHVWFNDTLFQHRWITEGLADEFAAVVVEAGGGEEPEPPTTVLFDVDARPLLEWNRYTTDPDVEEWGYGASWTVTSAIVDHIGMEALSEVVVAAANNEIAYLGDGRAERGRIRSDWKLYLDLIENRGDVEDDTIAELFERWVLSPSQAPLLDDRAASRETYAELAETGGFWAPPVGVRTAMSNWLFTRADELMVEAGTLVEGRDELIAMVAPLDASIPTELEMVYESAENSFDEANQLMAAATTTADGLRASQQKLDEATGVLQRVGAIGTDLPLQLDGAVADFEAGDLERADAAANNLDRDIDDLSRTGAIRVAVAVGSLLLLLALGFWLLRRRARRRSTPAEPDPSLPRFNTSGSSADWPAPTAPTSTVPGIPGSSPAIRTGPDSGTPDSGPSGPGPGPDLSDRLSSG